VTCTSKEQKPVSGELAGIVDLALCEPDLVRALRKAAETACAVYGVPKIYFAQALGKRLHYLTGYGEETYLPAVKEPLDGGIWVFFEGGESLTAEQKTRLVTALKQIVAAYTRPNDSCGASVTAINKESPGGKL
jgi:hypothetical protein